MRRTREPSRPIVDQVHRQMIEDNGITPPRNLEVISELLDRKPEILECVMNDLNKGLKDPRKGRRGLAAEQVLRIAILMCLYSWTYREAREIISDSLYMRKFIRFPFGFPLPHVDAINRAILRLSPSTMEKLNGMVVGMATEMGVEDGTRLRVDATVVETDVHHPTDSSLLVDCVRKLSNLMIAIAKVISITVPSKSTKKAQNLNRKIIDSSKKSGEQGEQARKELYNELLEITRKVLKLGREALDVAHNADDLAVVAKAAQLEHFSRLTVRVIDQTDRRVNRGEKVPANEKLVSIFETHTTIIRVGKIVKPTQFGRKVLLGEGGSGIVTDFRVLDGNPNDATQVASTLEVHQCNFGRAPDVYCADRGFFSEENVATAMDKGVVVCSIPKPGYKSKTVQDREAQPEFAAGQRWRAGIEGTISALKRGRGQNRCRWHGERAFILFIGLGVLTNNLMVLAKHTAQVLA